MIPQGGFGNSLFQQIQLPSKSYLIDSVNQRIVGYVDGLEAVQQAVYKILQTQRFEHSIYSSNYGSELSSIIGQNADFVQSELSRRVQQALLQDERIQAVENFNVTVTGDSALVEFKVVTQYGSFESVKEV
ncbi:hypothetical protein GCM10008018_06770 [Paenibacillus marchantiophytorum]|uniref:DUF2634 domain-containing protein n=1 Tax=Paenibacillus marchantiophytorum TaxID=1619310 RepID=A0ABQ2BT47_9BACL|nr:DUF2634 domain-containing protein [Paenibacillus marchantiophytorum]GGI44371.1 hypothetical protein GCM10008018_06770 [Paenibacillus marchantiophytorum]